MAESRPRFAARTQWNLELNRLARAAEERRQAGKSILDLTESNPTRCRFVYDAAAILGALADTKGLVYDPQPRGLPAAREAVAAYYGGRISADRILLTAGSSEAYGFLFRLLADPGDNVLVPQPGYPLFEFLSRLDDIELVGYRLEYHQGWEIDFGSLEAAAAPRTRAVMVIHPNNPTGSLVRPEEREQLVEFCRSKGLALIADEVFLDYCLPGAAGRADSFAGTDGVLSFTLNGLSKTAALPQMKLGWIVAGGPPGEVEEAMARLEIISDTYLSVGTPIQWALARLLAGRRTIQRQILTRVTENLRRLDERLARQSVCSRLEVEAGWSAVLRLPGIKTDEEWALELLDHEGVLVYPGHFFNFAGEGYLVVSLLPEVEVFGEGVGRLFRRIDD